jgi:hypothetical protein
MQHGKVLLSESEMLFFSNLTWDDALRSAKTTLRKSSWLREPVYVVAIYCIALALVHASDEQLGLCMSYPRPYP